MSNLISEDIAEELEERIKVLEHENSTIMTKYKIISIIWMYCYNKSIFKDPYKVLNTVENLLEEFSNQHFDIHDSNIHDSIKILIDFVQKVREDPEFHFLLIGDAVGFNKYFSLIDLAVKASQHNIDEDERIKLTNYLLFLINLRMTIPKSAKLYYEFFVRYPDLTRELINYLSNYYYLSIDGNLLSENLNLFSLLKGDD